MKTFLDALLFVRLPLTALLNFVKQILFCLRKDTLSDWNESKWEELFKISFKDSQYELKGHLYNDNKPYRKSLDDLYRKYLNFLFESVYLICAVSVGAREFYSLNLLQFTE